MNRTIKYENGPGKRDMMLQEMQKINQLAKELLTHGIASTSQEAVQKAEEMIRGTKTAEQDRNAQVAEQQHIQVRQLNTMISSLSKDVDALKQELFGIKETLAEHQRHIVKPVSQPVHKEVQQPLQTPQEASEKPSFNPADVAIDKVFYFGKK
jgi:septal ring factor EnvC (AmiA/AmiB activator)